MSQNNAASTGENSTPVAASATETASTAVTPETPTETTSSTSSLMDKLGVPAEVQQELESRKPKPETEAPAQAEVTEPTAEVTETSDTQTEENPTDEQHATNEWPESAKKRLAKERKKRGTAEERAEKAEEERDQLRAQLEATQPVTVTPSEEDLLADVRNEDQLAERSKQAKMLRDFLRPRLNGYTVGEGTPQERFVPPEEVATILGRVEDVLNEQVPKKATELQQRVEYNRVAEVKYPALFDPKTEDYQRKIGIIKRLPFLANDPALNMFVGDYLRGAQARIADENKAVATTGDLAADKILTARATIPPIAPNVPTAQRSNGGTPSRKNADQAMNNLVKDGSHEALVAAIGAKRASRDQSASRSLVSV